MYTGVFVFLIFALICAIAHMNGANFYLFGNRYDVVLTNSMSSKNEKYKDFLKGHNDQYQAFDVVVSKKVTKPTQLKQYDVVIYEDRYVGTNMHRIVDVIPNGSDDLTFEKATVGVLNDYKGILLPQIGSDLVSNTIQIQSLELTTFTTIDDNGDHFNFNVMSEDVVSTVVQKSVSGGFINTYSFKRTSKAPGILTIAHKYEYDYSKEIITGLKIKAHLGTIDVDPDKLTVEEQNLVGKYNETYKYEIRGDKSSTSDGIYDFKDIQAKVVRGIPKAGYLIRFLSSIWGGIMFILLAGLIIATDIIKTRLEKKETAKAEIETPQEQPETIEEHDDINNKGGGGYQV